MSDPIFLNDIWSLYFHDPYDNDWTNGSYVLLNTISTVEDFWQNFNCTKEHVHQGMLFCFREHIFPCWDDPQNIEGGVLSIKILKDNLPKFWEYLCINLLGETLLVENQRDKWKLVNGISTSPKKTFSIVKLWIKTDEIADIKNFDILDNYYGEIIYKSNIENITNDHARLASSNKTDS